MADPRKINATFVIVNLLYLAVVVLVVLQALSFEGQGGLVSIVLGIPTLALILVTLGRTFLSSTKKTDEELDDAAPWVKAGPIIGWVVGFCVLVLLLGFQISIPLYVFAFLRFRGQVSWPRCIVLAVSAWLVIYVTLDALLHRTLFEGLFFGAILPLL